jgi:hypothetical protein
MNGTMMDIVEDHVGGVGRGSHATGGFESRRRSGGGNRGTTTTTTAANRSRSSTSSNALDFSDTVEWILSAVEKRGENHDPHNGPLNRTEMSKLSVLCSQQQNSIKVTGTVNQAVLNEDLGFADVDVEQVGQLVEYLEKHVAMASNINLVQLSYEATKKMKGEEAGYPNLEEVRAERRGGACTCQIFRFELSNLINQLCSILIVNFANSGCKAVGPDY